MANNDSDDRAFGTLPTARERLPSPPASKASETMRLQPGFQLGKYRVVRHLGAGGMGAVYQAVHVDIGKPVALKVLSSALATDPRAQARFLQEAAAVSRLRHPHVVNVTDHGTQEGVPYIVMELLRGEDLADHIARHVHGLPVAETADILLAICAGVYAAHQAGITHRDLKPRNIFLDRGALREREPKVLDFGISKLEGPADSSSLTDSGAMLGTTHYMSPEQVLGRNVDFRTDVYSLGVVLYECLTGRRPHEGGNHFVVLRSIEEGRFVPPSKLRRDLPPDLEAVVVRAMARDPAGRFESMHALGAALLPFASPRKRVHWTDYYTRDPLEASLMGGEEPPIAPGSVAMMRAADGGRQSTKSYPAAPPPAQSLLTGPWAPAGQVPGTAQEPGVSSEAAGSTRSPKRARRAALAAALVFSLGAVAVGSSWRWNIPALNKDPPEPVALPVQDPPPKVPPKPRPALQDEVTIDVADGPPGLVAVVDGSERGLPLRIPRADRGRVLTFRAPGYVPKQVTIQPSQDRTLSIEMRQQGVTSSAASRPAPRRAGLKDPRPARKRDRSPESVPVFRDL